MTSALPDNVNRPLVFVVDDDATQLCIAEIYLLDDYDVRCFEDAREAMFAALKHSPQLVLSDIHMPGMGGVALREALLRAGARIPFVFLTGDGFAEELSGVVDLQGVFWLQKPMEKSVLLATVARALSP